MTQEHLEPPVRRLDVKHSTGNFGIDSNGILERRGRGLQAGNPLAGHAVELFATAEARRRQLVEMELAVDKNGKPLPGHTVRDDL